LIKNDILAYLNADDFYFPGTFSFVRTFMAAHHDIDVLVGAIKITDAPGRAKWRGRVSDPIKLNYLIKGNLHYFQQGTFFRRHIFERAAGFNDLNHTCWDYELIVDMASAGAHIKAISRPLAAFRIHPNSITGSGSLWKMHQADKIRIRQKIISQGVSAPSSIGIIWHQLEYRFNPVRFLKQMRPVVFNK
jgi:hypothetical protein